MMTRRAFDFYESPAWFIESLLDAEPVHGSVLEPCSGDQAIVRALSSARLAVLTNDINPRRQADHHLDANDGVSWQSFPPVDWVITNPPFSTAFSMLQHAYGHARIGVALYLRISFLETDPGARSLVGDAPIDALDRVAAAFLQRRRARRIRSRGHGWSGDTTCRRRRPFRSGRSRRWGFAPARLQPLFAEDVTA